MKTRVVRSTSRRAGRRGVGKRRKRNTAVLTKIQIKSGLIAIQFKNWARVCAERSQRFGWRRLTQWSTMTRQLIEVCGSFEKQKEKDIPVKGITCEINRIERLKFDNLANLTGPDPKKLGASTITQFLTANGPQEKTYILDMLPDTGTGVTLISEKVARERRKRINKSEAHMYKIRDASEQNMVVIGTVKLMVIPKGSCVP